MSEEIEIAGIKVPKADWEATPSSIQSVVLTLSERVAQLEAKLAQLSEQVNQNSQNSSKPPSTDGFGQPKQGKGKHKQHQRRQRSSPSKAPRQARKLSAPESCTAIHEVLPKTCHHCGTDLKGQDTHPHRHQVIELPKLEPSIIEYRLHQLNCHQCGRSSQAPLPVGVSSSGYGEHLSALVALLSGTYRQSYRQVCALMGEVFNVPLSRGCVGRLRQEISAALIEPVAEAQGYVQTQPVIHSDETSFKQGNRDGQNPTGRKGWLWVLVSPLVSFFEVALSRSQATAQTLMGSSFAGILNSDRYSGYQWVEVNRRQVCWAHLKRDLTAIAERTGVSSQIGDALLRRERRLFRWWYQVRDGPCSRGEFIERVQRLRAGFRAVLEAAVALPIGHREKTPLAKTVRTCKALLKVEAALWTFVEHEGVEPTNNAAERALRPAVIWRRTSFGAQSQAGSQFVARMLTVTTSLKAQNRNILDFLMEACHSARFGLSAPSLIPEAENSINDHGALPETQKAA